MNSPAITGVALPALPGKNYPPKSLQRLQNVISSILTGRQLHYIIAKSFKAKIKPLQPVNGCSG